MTQEKTLRVVSRVAVDVGGVSLRPGVPADVPASAFKDSYVEGLVKDGTICEFRDPAGDAAEASEIVSNARAEAEKILADARAEAEKILAAAGKPAGEIPPPPAPKK